MEDVETKEIYAVKKVQMTATDNGVDPLLIREIACLTDLHNSNIIELIDAQISGPTAIIIFEHLDTDLEKYVLENPKQIPVPIIKSLMSQLLNGILYCHSKGVVHRDLKPSNILLKLRGPDDVLLKIGDFGLSKSISPAKRSHTLEVVTRVYRAPEILLGCREYDKSVDLWSIGCTFFFIVTKHDLFFGESEIETLFQIFSRLGTPTSDCWPEFRKLPFASSRFPAFMKRQWEPEVEKLFGVDGMELLSCLLEVNPSKRVTAEEALRMKYFTN